MCGIVGYVGPKNAVELLLEGLRRLEYRGYDSAGIGIINAGEPVVRKTAGKIALLTKMLEAEPLASHIGIGHTRWATHGEPTSFNAHPHQDCSGQILLVHNGIIENHHSLRQALLKRGHHFRSQTDTEVIAHLIEEHLKDDLLEAVKQALKEVEGSYALAVMSSRFPEQMVAARKDSPLVIGLGQGENFLASDIPALIKYTNKMVYLEDEEIALITKDGFTAYRLSTGQKIKPEPLTITWNSQQIEKGGFDHFMLKEIYEQPHSLKECQRGRLTEEDEVTWAQEKDLLPPEAIEELDKIALVACGTAHHAALVARYMLEEHCDLPVEVDFSSEFRYRWPKLTSKSLALFVSQSGETADTLAALRKARAMGSITLSICNVVGSSMARESQGVFFTRAGPEIGVASTKAYTSQLTALFLFTLFLARERQTLPKGEIKEMVRELREIPALMQTLIERAGPQVKELAKRYAQKSCFLYLGRGYNYPTALEGALKMKEISYIHAEGYPAGEMKHGPIALIEEGMPVVCIVSRGKTYEKMLSNLQEIKARKGTIIALATEGDEEVQSLADHVIALPPIIEPLSPILTVLPLQLFAYYVAVERGCDVDQPRNLAKSVTVE